MNDPFRPPTTNIEEREVKRGSAVNEPGHVPLGRVNAALSPSVRVGQCAEKRQLFLQSGNPPAGYGREVP